MTSLKLEIIQERPFASPREEAFLSLLRTADCLQRAFHLKARGWGLTSTQYNVLRILRGAQPQGLTCSAIGERMITAVPDITRLLGRLKTMKFITQKRDCKDRRVVWTRITPEGLDLLRQMEPLIEVLPMELLGHMPEEEIARLIELLEKARRPHTQPVCPTLAK
jgi:DNA-binding MarR family transcriptional regulator